MYFLLKDKQKIKQFVHFLKNAHIFTEILHFYFNEDLLEIQFMNNSNTCLGVANITCGWFDEYKLSKNADENKITTFTKTLQKVLNCLSDDNTLEFECVNEEKMNIYLNSTKEGHIIDKKQFEIHLVDSDFEKMQFPEQEFEADMELNSSLLLDLSREMSGFGENVTFFYNQEDLYFESNGDNGNYKVIIDLENLNEFTVDEDCNLNVSYAMKQFEQICVFTKLSDNTKLYISQDKPIRFAFDLDNNENIEEFDDLKNYIIFYLAPKIGDNY